MNAQAEPRRRGILVPVVFVLAAVAGLVALGTWQLERKAWKESLIAELESKLSAQPVALLPREVTEYYVGHGIGAQVPIMLDCRMDPFGIATLREAPLSPAAFAVLETIRERATELYLAETD